jgi:hypothetical protein
LFASLVEWLVVLSAAQHRCFVGFAECFILLVSRLRGKDGLMDNLGLKLRSFVFSQMIVEWSF